MFPITPALKAYAVKNLGAKANATDGEVRALVQKAVFGGKLDSQTFKSLTTVQKKSTEGKTKTKAPVQSQSPVNNTLVKQLLTRIGDLEKGQNATLKHIGQQQRSSLSAESVLAKGMRVTVKEAASQYADTKSAAIYPTRVGKSGSGAAHPLAGRPASIGTTSLYLPSDRDKAVAAAWLKWSINSSNKGNTGIPENMQLDDHSKELVMYAMHNMPWNGAVRGKSGVNQLLNRKGLKELHIKALLDDTVSGGIEATPAVFDDAIILYPVLNGELFPFVNVVNIAKGRRIKGATLGNPTFTSGTAEGTAIQPFNTASLVGAFDTPIFVATGAMEIGLDFEEDSPVDLGANIIDRYGEKALEWLDRVIAVGNGTSEPLGIFSTPGLSAILSDQGAGAPPTVADYESLMFGVAKQYRKEPGAVCAFLGSDTSYRRACSIPVGPTDQRRVFGMDHADYMLLKCPYKVQNDITNNKIAFANLKRYRMYRRLGLQVRVETGGRQLASSNTKLVVVRMRYGGQMETANAVSVITDAQS